MFSLMTRFHFYFYFLLKLNSTPSTVIYYFQIKVTHPTICKQRRHKFHFGLRFTIQLYDKEYCNTIEVF